MCAECSMTLSSSQLFFGKVGDAFDKPLKIIGSFGKKIFLENGRLQNKNVRSSNQKS